MGEIVLRNGQISMEMDISNNDHCDSAKWNEWLYIKPLQTQIV